jgi:hypothetical protein
VVADPPRVDGGWRRLINEALSAHPPSGYRSEFGRERNVGLLAPVWGTLTN